MDNISIPQPAAGVLPTRPMDRQLLKACSTGDLRLFKQLVDGANNPDDILLSTTPHLNNCLHIAAMLGHAELAKEVWTKSKAPSSLFSSTNIDGETPLITALMAANKSLASEMIAAAQDLKISDLEGGMQLKEMLLKADRRGENALHHAMRNGFPDMALWLLDIEPQLSRQDNKSEESWKLSEQIIQSKEYSDTKPPLPKQVRQSNEFDTKPPQPKQSNQNKESRHSNDPLFQTNRSKRNWTKSQLPKQVNKSKESPMYMAARKGYLEVVEKLLAIESSAHSGGHKESALHAAVRFGRTDIVKELLKRRPELATSTDSDGDIPLVLAVFHNNIDLVKIFLEHDPNLAYFKNEGTENTPFVTAAEAGSVLVAEEIRNACPDAVYTPNKDGFSALHKAILSKQTKFIDYVLRTPQLRRLINQTTNNGTLPLHHAAKTCNPKLLRSLLSLSGHDYTAVNDFASNAVNIVCGQSSSWSTLQWKESFALLLTKIPSGWKHFVRSDAKQKMEKKAIQDVRSLTEKYISRTSWVAALLATITFAAAFTLPGGFSTDPSEDGLPVLARKAAFQVFLISDTIAMCSSLAAAFLCILSTWEDLEILLNYKRMTTILMWCAFGATSVAFGTGLFTVMAPEIMWLAILILVLCSILPFLTKIIGEWPLLMLSYRLGGHFPKDLVPII